MPRVKISEFGVVQKLLAGATVQILSANDSGESTGNLATLYEAATGSGVVSNPQILDEDGKLSIDCYVDGIVVAEISNISDLAERTIKKLRANPVEFPLGATNANYQGVSVIGLVDDAEGYANQAESYLNLIEDTFQGIPSTSNLSISSGSKTFAVASGLPFGVGQYIIATSNANPTTHSMNGQITAYSGGSLTITVDAFLGSGSRADWTIRGSGPRGATGATGPAGAGSGDMLKSELLSGLSNYPTARANMGLGSAATASTSDFATAAQGALANTALQPASRTAANGMAMVLLDTQVASGAVNLDFTSLISTDYDSYIFELQDIVPSNNGATIFSRFSSNNGVSWISANYARCGRANSIPSAVTAALGIVNQNEMPIFSNLSNVVKYAMCAELKLINPLSTTVLKKMHFNVAGASGSPLDFYDFNGYFLYEPVTDVAINAVRFGVNVGTFNGTIRMYGIRKT